jgi:hypothetical protein
MLLKDLLSMEFFAWDLKQQLNQKCVLVIQPYENNRLCIKFVQTMKLDIFSTIMHADMD